MNSKTITFFLFYIFVSPCHATDSLFISSLDTIKVKSTKQRKKDNIKVSEVEKKMGLVHDLNLILTDQITLSQPTDAGSSVLSQGQSSFDVLYRVQGIPVFSPSHFANQTIFDRSSLSINSINSITLLTTRSAGAYVNAPAAVIGIDPAIRRSENKFLKRPELWVHIGQNDMQFSYSWFKKKFLYDFYELSIRFVNTEYLNALSLTNTDSDFLGPARPKNYSELIFNGTTHINRFKVSEFFLGAVDIYFESFFNNFNPIKPWSIFSFSLQDTVSPHQWNFLSGGSQHYYAISKVAGPEVALRHIENRCITFTGSSFLFPYNQSHITSIKTSLELFYWNSLLEKMSSVPDSTSSIQLKQPKLTLVKTSRNIRGIYYLQNSFQHTIENNSLGTHILLGMSIPSTALFINPCIWFQRYIQEQFFVEHSIGIMSSLPDIRGVPDKAYSQKIINNYSATAKIKWDVASNTELVIEDFITYKDHCPQMSRSPTELKWDPSLATPLLATGIDCGVTVPVSNNYSLHQKISFHKSLRYVQKKFQKYEWDQPWASVTTLHYASPTDKHHVYIRNTAFAYVPYRKVEKHTDGSIRYSEALFSIPGNYCRFDIKYEMHNPIFYHRYLVRYDGYVEITNCTRIVNIREYYWNSLMEQQVLPGNPLQINIGVRAGFRL